MKVHLIILVATLVIGLPALATPKGYLLDVVAKGEKKSDKINEKKFLKACQKVGKSFVSGEALWGYGIASDYRCFVGKKKISGIEGAPAKLRLNITFSESEVSFSLSFVHFKGSKEKLSLLSKVALENSSRLLKGLEKNKIARLLATRILDSAPLATIIDIEKNSAITVNIESKVSLPKELTIFTIKEDPKASLLLPNIAATALPEISRRSMKYRITSLEPHLDKNKLYFAQNADGPGKKEFPLNSALNRQLKSYNSKVIIDNGFLLDTLSGGYGGFRYGLPMASGDPLVAKAPMVGIFTEVRGGILEGLRWYWDIGPETKHTEEGEDLSFTWSRPTIGWAIEFNMFQTETMTFTLDLTPKVGALDLEGVFLVKDESGTSSKKSFTVKNATSFGIDGGLTWETKWFLLRAWGASDLAGVVSIGDNSTRISSLRAGIDSFWDLFTLGEVLEFSLLAFASAESLSIAKNPTADAGVSGELAIDEVGFTTVFLGLGGTIQW